MNYIDHSPSILKETANGIVAVNLIDDMFEQRQINLVSQIDADVVNSTINQMRYLARINPDAAITLYINSPGGSVSDGLALYDVMKSLPCPVNTVCMGMAASMASLLFVAGAHREMLPHSRLMVHDPLISGGLGGSALSIKAVSDDLMRTREIAATILSENTGLSMEEVYQLTSKDTYLEAEEAIEHGFADAIVTSI